MDSNLLTLLKTQENGKRQPLQDKISFNQASNIRQNCCQMVKKNTTTQNSMDIKATQEVLYQAFTDPKASAVWHVPEKMTGKVHDFGLKVGSGYQMSLL